MKGCFDYSCGPGSGESQGRSWEAGWGEGEAGLGTGTQGGVPYVPHTMHCV